MGYRMKTENLGRWTIHIRLLSDAPVSRNCYKTVSNLYENIWTFTCSIHSLNPETTHDPRIWELSLFNSFKIEWWVRETKVQSVHGSCYHQFSTMYYKPGQIRNRSSEFKQRMNGNTVNRKCRTTNGGSL